MSITVDSTILEKYRIVRLLGQGGMARVWLAEEIAYGRRQVAIKEPLEAVGGDDEIKQRFTQELDVYAALEKAHTPNIVRVFTVEQYAGQLLLVMEYLPGNDLVARLKEHNAGLPVAEAVAIASQVLAALRVAHDHRMEIVHRDIKPANILFDGEGGARLADFGLAQLAGASMRSQFQGQSHPGTPAYMAPEQSHSVQALTPAADIYAVGAVLFEMLTGKRYNRVQAGTSVHGLRRDVSPALDAVVAQALRPEPYARYQTAGEMAAALATAMQPAVPPVRRGRLIGAVVVLVSVLLALTLWQFWGGTGAPPSFSPMGGGAPATGTVTIASAITADLTPADTVAPTPTATLPAPEIDRAGLAEPLPAGPQLISGTGAPGATVRLQVNGMAAGETTVDAGGHWRHVVQLTTPGRVWIVAEAYTPDGVLLTASEGVETTILAATPTATPTPEPSATPTPCLAGALLVDGNCATVTPRPTPSATTVPTAPATPAPSATHTVAPTATPSPTATPTVTSRPTVTWIAPQIDTGQLTGVQLVGPVLLEGIGEPGAAVRIYVNAELAGRTTVDAQGHWRQVVTLATPGRNLLLVELLDQSGQLLRVSEGVALEVAQPTATVTPTPVANATRTPRPTATVTATACPAHFVRVQGSCIEETPSPTATSTPAPTHTTQPTDAPVQPAMTEISTAVPPVSVTRTFSATGYGYGSDIAKNPAQREQMALRAAEIVAKRNLAEIVYGTVISSETNSLNGILIAEITMSTVNAFVTNAVTVEQSYDPQTDQAIVTVEMSLNVLEP